MKKLLLSLTALCLSNLIFAQEDLLDLLDETLAKEAPVTEYTMNTFKAVRIVNSHSTEMPVKNDMQFIISHRFGRLDQGWRDFFGIDNADMRIGIEYGIFDWWSAGFGRSSVGGTIDLYTRLKILRQSKGAKNIPVTMVWYSNMGFNTKPQSAELDKVHRLSYAHQLLISRKFTRDFSFQVMPTYVHQNIVPTPNDKNDVFAVGFGARYLITRSVSLNLEYFQPTTKREDGELYTGSLAFGIDIETGGHVFQVTLSNSTGMIEQFYLSNNTGQWWDKEIRLGFNINRNITFSGKKKKTKEPGY